MLSEVTPTKGLQSYETEGNGILCQIFHFLLVKEFKKIISKTAFSSMSRYQSRYFQNISF